MTMDGVSYCEVAKMRNQINSLTKENDELKQSKEALVKTRKKEPYGSSPLSSSIL